MLSDQQILELISCTKRVSDPPTDKGINRGSTKIVFSLTSIESELPFSAFITRNQKFPENFSLGLTTKLSGERGQIVLIRVNGPHGPTKEETHHSYCHVHTITANNVLIGGRHTNKIEIVTAFSTYETGLRYFLARIGVLPEDRHRHFPPPNDQTSFNFEVN